MKRFITGLTVALALCWQMPASPARIQREDIRIPGNRVVYSVYLRNYVNPEASATFNDLRRDITRLKELGIDVIHLLPFYEMGIEHAKGSPYCIRDYRSVDSRYGTMDDLRTLVDELHANGMQIWFDWVGNHTAYDHPWVKAHPDWYTERQDFDDVRSVNSKNPDLRKAMAEEMRFWVDEMGIDGFRCDFAHAPGRDFWVDIIGMVDPGHKLYWLAEGDEGGIANDWVRGEGGPFDSRYGWSYAEFLYKDEYSRKDATSTGDSGKAMFHLGYPENRASFLTYIGSHDIFQGMPPHVSPNTQDCIYGDNLVPFTVMTMLAPGVPMVYMGQEINYSKPGGIGIMTDTEAIDWTVVDKEYLSLVKELITLRHTEPALQTLKGKLLNHPADNDSVYVFERRNGNNSVVAMVNFSYRPQQFRISSRVIPSNVYYNVAENDSTRLAGELLTLPAKGYAIYVKGNEKLKADRYTVSITVPDYASWTGTPLLNTYVPDPLGNGGDVYVIKDGILTPESTKPGTYRMETDYLPEFGYYLYISNGNGDRTDAIRIESPDNVTLLIEGNTLRPL